MSDGITDREKEEKSGGNSLCMMASQLEVYHKYLRVEKNIVEISLFRATLAIMCQAPRFCQDPFEKTILALQFLL